MKLIDIPPDNSGNDELIGEVVKLAPPVGVSTLSFLGCPVSDFVYIMTILYLFIQILCTLYRTYHFVKKIKDNTKGDE